MVWNRGVSYGLLTQDGDLGRWLLIALGIAGALLFGWWLWSDARACSPALSLGLVVGGALSNVIDRLVYGAVADFFLFHVGGFEWYVFNLADVWIVAGVDRACCSPGRPSAPKSPRRHETRGNARCRSVAGGRAAALRAIDRGFGKGFCKA